MPLSPSQQMAVDLTSGPAMILAGPGSGKTTVITHRIKHLIASGVSSDRILVITFTRAAARQMKARFYDLGPGANSRVSFGTFHAIFFQILRAAYGYGQDSILLEDERFRLLAGIAERLHLETEDLKTWVADVSSEISHVKTENINLDLYYSATCPEEDFRRLYRLYEEEKLRMRKIDFDDMCAYTADLFHARKDILAHWQSRFSYLLIDEFQDINALQYRIVRDLALPENNLFIVGDDDQSIYRFRGSKPEIMLNFKRDYPDARTIFLNENYRSTGCIVDASLMVIGQNRHRIPKNLRSVSDRGDPVEVLECKDPEEEASYLSGQIRKSMAQGIRPGEIAILTRTNLQGRGPAEKLMEYTIPVRVRDQMPLLYDHFICQDFLAYLKLAGGDRSQALFLRVCNRPNRYISREAVRASCRQLDGRSLLSFRALHAYYQDKPWMEDRISLLERDLDRIGAMKVYAAINYIRMGMGYDSFLKDYAAKRKMNPEDLTETEDEVQENARPFEAAAQWEGHIEEYRRKMKDLQEERRRSQDQGEDAVTLSTFHSAKGLEFKEVFLLDTNEGIIPYKKASLPEEIEEERRLFYVAMTRAKRKLHILYVRERFQKKLKPSRFLDALKRDQEEAGAGPGTC